MCTFETNPDSKETDEDVVDTLLRLPSKNLEERIKLLDQEIRERQALNDQILSSLGTKQVQADERASQMAYALPSSPEFRHKESAEEHSLRLEALRINECLAFLHDLFQLREKAQEAQEELKAQRKKLKLLES